MKIVAFVAYLSAQPLYKFSSSFITVKLSSDTCPSSLKVFLNILWINVPKESRVYTGKPFHSSGSWSKITTLNLVPASNPEQNCNNTENIDNIYKTFLESERERKREREITFQYVSSEYWRLLFTFIVCHPIANFRRWRSWWVGTQECLWSDSGLLLTALCQLAVFLNWMELIHDEFICLRKCDILF